jgi:hypothetical protein
MIPRPIALEIQNRAYPLAVQQLGRSSIVSVDEIFLNVLPTAVFTGPGQFYGQAKDLFILFSHVGARFGLPSEKIQFVINNLFRKP